MTVEIRVPQLPESIADALLVAWHKQPGDSIRRDENLADLETDKVVLEVPSPLNGVMREIRIPSGTTVTSGQVLAVIEEGSVTAAQTDGGKTSAEPDTSASGQGAPREAGKLSPSVRRLLEENHLDAAAIPTSRKDGRLTKSDVVDFLDRHSKADRTPTVAVNAPVASEVRPEPGLRPESPGRSLASGERSEKRVPMTRLRQRIAQRLVEAQSTQALLTSFNEVDLTAIQEMRSRYKERFEKEYAVKLGFMAFFVKAAIEALKRFPVINASVDGNDIVYHEYYDIGVAVSTERGLMVPVVRDADLKSFAMIETEIAQFAKKARDGSIGIEDLTGGTFTITNGGVFGSLMSTPIVNAPQSAILGMHKTQDRPMVVNGGIAIRPMMYLAVTYDHRIIDGREAVQFLVAIKECLEDPGRMLLGI